MTTILHELLQNNAKSITISPNPNYYEYCIEFCETTSDKLKITVLNYVLFAFGDTIDAWLDDTTEKLIIHITE